ncbi:MAG: tail fiber domain-containing protein [Flavitalea sp.]
MKQIYLFCSVIILSLTARSQDIMDISLKRNISPINNPLQKLALLEPRSFEYNTAEFKHLRLKSGQQYGFIADEIQSVFPELVSRRSVPYMFGKNTYRNSTIKVVQESGLIPILVASIKEQQAEIEKLKQAILVLQKPSASLE